MRENDDKNPTSNSVRSSQTNIANAQTGTQTKGQPDPNNDDQDTKDYETALELTGSGVFNYLALISCTCIFMHALTEMIGMAYVVDPAECDLDLTVMQKTLIGSAIFFGVMLTSICWGALGDMFGRKKVMLPAIFATIVTSTISSMCTVFWSMFLMRFLTGALVAASSATILVYLGELNSEHHRDTAISWAITIVAVAFVIVPAIAWLIIPGKWSFTIFKMKVQSWRVFMWTFSISGLIGAILMIFLPESPSYVLSHNGEMATIPILARMYHFNHLKEKTNHYPVHHLKGTVAHGSGDSAIINLFKDMSQLFRYPMRRPFLITHYCMFMVFLLANGVYLWMPGIFNLVLQDTKLPWTICMAIQSRYTSKADDDFVMMPHHGGSGEKCGEENMMMYPMAMIMEFTFLVPFLIITYVIEKFDKGLLYAWVMIPCAVGLATCVVIPQVVAAAVFMTIGLCSGSAAAILTALAVEAFPTSLRALVMCTMYMMGQVGAVLGNTMVGIAAKGFCEVIFFLMSILVAVSVLSLVLLWPNLHDVRVIMESRNYAY